MFRNPTRTRRSCSTTATWTRLCRDTSYDYRKPVVSDVLKMRRIRDSIIGDEVKGGISGGQQKHHTPLDECVVDEVGAAQHHERNLRASAAPTRPTCAELKAEWMGANWSGLATPDPDKTKSTAISRETACYVTDALSRAALLADFVVDWGAEQMSIGEDTSLGRKKQSVATSSSKALEKRLHCVVWLVMIWCLFHPYI